MNAHVVEKDETIMCGKIKVRFFGVTHTFPDSLGIIIETKHGWIVTPGDYKLDQIDGIVSKEEEKEYSIFDKAKTLLLMTDSTNVENEGFALPETKSASRFGKPHQKNSRAHYHRGFCFAHQPPDQIVQIAEIFGKKIVLNGRSMKTNMDVAIEAKLFKPKKGYDYSDRTN